MQPRDIIEQTLIENGVAPDVAADLATRNSAAAIEHAAATFKELAGKGHPMARLAAVVREIRRWALEDMGR